jgi:DNA polymerase III subunit epsilon
MMKNLRLEKPLAFIDIETTGLSPFSDRIVELSILKISPNGSQKYKSHIINPKIPIPAEATAIHGITDADVSRAPSFSQYAKAILDFLSGCDMSGFNLIKFDLPFLEAEFRRTTVEFSRQNRRFIDTQILYHRLEPRDLSSAYVKYCGKELVVKHSAQGDATAAAEILDGQLEKHPELPRNVSELGAICYQVPQNYVDPDGKFIWSQGEAVCHFGKKHNGHRLTEIASHDQDYLKWIAQCGPTSFSSREKASNSRLTSLESV